MAHIRQAGPNSGLGCQVNVLETFQVVPSAHGLRTVWPLCSHGGLRETVHLINFDTNSSIAMDSNRIFSWIYGMSVREPGSLSRANGA